MEQSFAKLFRASKFANYQAGLGQVIKATPKTGNSFGLKRNLNFKKPVKAIQVTKLDAEFNQTDTVDREWQSDRAEFLEEIMLRVGTSENHNNMYAKMNGKQALLYGSHLPLNGKTTVVGRLLSKYPEGYSVGIGGEVAFLPLTEVPNGFFFTYSDFINRNAFTFEVKYIHVDSKGKSFIVVSMR